MHNSPLDKIEKILCSEDGQSKVILYDPRDNTNDQAFLDSISDIEPYIKIDFQFYDLNKRDSLFYIYLDLKYYALEIVEKLESKQLKRFVNLQFKRGFQWAKSGSQVPISNFLRNFCETFHDTFKKYPWIILANIDVETDIIHANIGSLVFDLITSSIAERVIITCSPESWANFEKGRDIFARIASRLRSSVKKL